ncbi:DNA repair protein XRCC3 [Orussus abietinus]|uniref:DNA repair protein XRCC3-like n=1 Tax=Orussus abietinus TaxID=222816 RepID=UPI000626139E|nr:DNA repair protein XRCC3-like [Orussus abietinus]XP_012278226.1 DNA repair protein XRCC3 [Orussus abietinus]
MLQPDEFLTSGCPVLNSNLRGGINRKGLTEIYGQSGTGKTQLALQLCLTVQIPIAAGGLGAGAAYICTESVFPTRRLLQLLKTFPNVEKYNITGDSVFIEHVSTIEDLEMCVIRRIPILMESQKIGLIILDSIAAPYRVEYSDSELKNRARSLRSIGYQLHILSFKNRIPVVCINQVTAVVKSDCVDNLLSKEQPALGITWANLVSNSLYLYKSEDHRYVCVKKSSYVPRTVIKFNISDSGVFGIA